MGLPQAPNSVPPDESKPFLSGQGQEREAAKRTLDAAQERRNIKKQPGERYSRQAGLLGKNGSISSQPQQPPQEAAEVAQEQTAQQLKTIERYAMQSAARVLLPGEAVAGCHRWATGGQEGIRCWHVPAVKGARLEGVQTCRSVWACPVCAAKITERRRIELRQAVDSWRAQGGSVVMLTFTLSHERSDNLASLLGASSSGTKKDGDFVPASGLLGARSVAMSGRAYHDLKQQHGLAGSVRALEVTFGDNGWHPHIHELAFVEAGGDAGRLVAGLEAQWHHGLAAVGLNASWEHGVSWSEAGAEIETYIAKFGHEPTRPVWDCAAEVAKQPAKLGRAKGRSPMQLLADFMNLEGEAAAVSGRLFQTYFHAMKGRHQLQWSRRLRGRLGLGRELTEAEICDSANEAGVLMATLGVGQWRCIVADDRRAELVNVLKSGDMDALRLFLADYPDMRRREGVRVFHPVLINHQADERDKLLPVGAGPAWVSQVPIRVPSAAKVASPAPGPGTVVEDLMALAPSLSLEQAVSWTEAVARINARKAQRASASRAGFPVLCPALASGKAQGARAGRRPRS